MKAKRIYIEAKKSANFQTYTVGLDIELSLLDNSNLHKADSEPDYSLDSEELDLLIRKAQAKCRKLAREQINIDRAK